MADYLGQQLGHYRLIQLLGRGGFAEVYLGEHLHLKTQAAVKVLHSSLEDDYIDEFLREAQTVARLRHPHIVRVFDFDVQNQTPFLVMDYLPNGNVRRSYPKGKSLALPTVVSYLKQMSSALQYAHNEKLIHRDVKPENMLLDRDGSLVLSDFGIAIMTQSSRMQSTQEVAGTAAYMAPEQFRGHPHRASDQYALGIVVYEWLSGERPFRGTFSEIASQHLFIPPPSIRERIPTISPDVERVVLTALEKDPHKRFANVQAFATAFEQASNLDERPKDLSSLSLSSSPTVIGTLQEPSSIPVSGDVPSLLPPTLSVPQSTSDKLFIHTDEVAGQPQSFVSEPPAPVLPSNRTTLPPVTPLIPPSTGRKRPGGPSRIKTVLLVGLAVLVIIGSAGLISFFATKGSTTTTTTTTTTTVKAVPGGTWTDDLYQEPTSLIPNAAVTTYSALVDQAIYAPLFVGDTSGNITPGLATVVPTIANGGVSSDAKTWTFHLRPNLKWSDGQPLDARDVDFTWKLWTNPKFPAASTVGLNLITSTDVSADNLTITFHLKQSFSPFLATWTDGLQAPLPAHHYQAIPPNNILTSHDNLDPTVTSGPFMMKESFPGDHYTVVRNPNYYRAAEGLPYLDSVKFRIVTNQDTILKDLQAGTINSSWFLDVTKTSTYQHLTNYTLFKNPNTSNFETMYFNFHNTTLGKYPEVRQAMAMAINHQALIETARRGQAALLCTDHGSAYHPGYQPNAPCPKFDPTAANALLDQHGWVKEADGVRTKGGMRLEFEYSTIAGNTWRTDNESILQSNFTAIGIKIDIQNYPASTFFGTFLTGGNPSPSTGAIAGKYDIAEFENVFYYDADDSSLLACNQFPPNGINYNFYCNSQLDQLYVQEQSTPDPNARQQVFNQIHQIYLTDFPFITLYSPQDLAIYKNGMHNYNPAPFGATETINIWQWWCDGGHC